MKSSVSPVKPQNIKQNMESLPKKVLPSAAEVNSNSLNAIPQNDYSLMKKSSEKKVFKEPQEENRKPSLPKSQMLKPVSDDFVKSASAQPLPDF